MLRDDIVMHVRNSVKKIMWAAVDGRVTSRKEIRNMPRGQVLGID